MPQYYGETRMKADKRLKTWSLRHCHFDLLKVIVYFLAKRAKVYCHFRLSSECVRGYNV